MNGVVKDETPSTVSDTKSGEPADKVHGDLAGQDGAAPDATSANSRRAPHLRVVTEASDLPDGEPDAEAQQPELRMGQLLQRTRENKGLTLEQVSRETRITVTDLQAIEEMTPSAIRGGEVYIKGHVRNYARHLGLNPDETLARYKADVPLLADPLKPQVIPQTKPADTASKSSTPVAFIAGAAVVAVAAIGAWVVMSGDKDAPDVAAAPAAPAVQSPSPAVRAATAPPLRLVALRRARIIVRGADGTKFLQRYMAPGESYAPRTGAGWTVSADEDGSAFEWRLGDQSLGLLSPEGGPVYAQSVDSALSRTPVGPAADIVTPATTDDGLNLDIPGAVPPSTPPTPVRAPVEAGAPPAAPGGAQASAPPKPKPKPAPTQAAAETPPAPTEPAAPAPSPAVDPALAAYPQ